jgi:hypothetical protein
MSDRAKKYRVLKHRGDMAARGKIEQEVVLTVLGGGNMPADFTSKVWSPNDDPMKGCYQGGGCVAVFRDFDSDGTQEILIVGYNGDDLYARDGAVWAKVGSLPASCDGDWEALRSGNFTLERPKRIWRDIVINGHRVPIAPDVTCAAAKGADSEK